MICKVCNNPKNNRIYEVKEMMYGMNESFEYLECSKCGTLQIKNIPKDVKKYYPFLNYYSFNTNRYNSLLKTLIKMRDKYSLLKTNLVGKIINLKFPNLFFEVLGELNINYKSKILDVGCGNGDLLFHLNELGFNNLIGIDPYTEYEINTNKIKIMKKDIRELTDEKFDFIILSHSFEHMDDPFKTLNSIRNNLSKKGVCIIRMPIKTDYIWNKYKTFWVQIDAPRHFFIYTQKGFDCLIEKTGFILENVFFDSNELQFWGSEQYKKGIPLQSENSYSINPKKSIFSPKEIRKFKKEANELNSKKQGDQAIFLLKKQ